MPNIGEDLLSFAPERPKPLGPSQRARQRRERRDFWLCLAAAALPGDFSPWGRAVALLGKIAKFEFRKWPTWVQLSEPPANASEIERALFEAFRSGAPIPTSVKQLDKCLSRNGS